MSVYFTNLAKWKINDFEIKYRSFAGTAPTVSYPVKLLRSKQVKTAL
jgi:hypothetical protein